MSGKIGDVYNGGRKIGELRGNSGGGWEGCAILIALVVLGVSGVGFLCTRAFNLAAYGVADTSAATVETQATRCQNGVVQVPLTTQYAKQTVIQCYDNDGQWANIYVLKTVNNMTMQQLDACDFVACVDYQFADVSSPNVTAGEDRRTFAFEPTDDGTSWQITSMGDHLSC